MVRRRGTRPHRPCVLRDAPLRGAPQHDAIVVGLSDAPILRPAYVAYIRLRPRQALRGGGGVAPLASTPTCVMLRSRPRGGRRLEARTGMLGRLAVHDHPGIRYSAHSLLPS